MTSSGRLKRLEQALRERDRQAADHAARGAGYRAEVEARIDRHWSAALVAAHEGRTHYLFAADKLAHLEARLPGPFADWWRALSKKLEAVRQGVTA